MNWYHIASINPAELVAAKITRQVFEQIKAGKEDFLFSTPDIPNVSVVSGYVLPLQPPHENDPLNIRAAYYVHTNETNHIGITINVPQDFGPEYYSQLYAELQTAIRHEIEHSTESREKIIEEGAQAWQRNRPTPEAAEKYLTSLLELPANVAGMYYQAKKTKKPFIEVLDNWIAAWKKIYARYPSEILTEIFDRVRKKLLNYARKRYPKAQL